MCDDVPFSFTTGIGTCPTPVDVCTSVAGVTASTVCTESIYPPRASGQYVLHLTYDNTDCSGEYTGIAGELADSCIAVGSSYRKHTCSGGKVTTATCSDNACSEGCLTTTQDDGQCTASVNASVKLECSSGFQTVAFASVTALLAAVASALSFF